MAQFELNKEKTIHALLYICQKLGGSWDKYALLKILYFADRLHLAQYGRPITGDRMVAMSHGPVPSFALNCINYPENFDTPFAISEGYVVTAKETANEDVFSDSDVECLDISIEENKSLGFGQLKEKSHDTAYEKAVNDRGPNATMSALDIARAGGADDSMLQYIAYISENQLCQLNAPE
jgi:uncharacterized phage-associated protein